MPKCSKCDKVIKWYETVRVDGLKLCDECADKHLGRKKNETVKTTSSKEIDKTSTLELQLIELKELKEDVKTIKNILMFFLIVFLIFLLISLLPLFMLSNL